MGLEFGDVQTADVLLTLAPEVVGPFPLHSGVLCRADFFKAQLSEAWTSASDKKPRELLVKNCKDTTRYVRFLQLLYNPELQRHFSSVEEALGILEVADQLLCNECVKSCMSYLEAVPWSLVQEQAIRSCISSLNLTPSPELALRLAPPAWDPTEEMTNMLNELMCLAGWNDQAVHVIDSLMLENMKSEAFALVNENVLLQGLQSNVAAMKRAFVSHNAYELRPPLYSTLTWLLGEFQRFNIAGTAIKFLAGEGEFANLLSAHVTSCDRLSMHEYRTLFEALSHLFERLGDGMVTVSREIRSALMTSWFPVFVRLHSRYKWYPDYKLDWIPRVIESLPMTDQQTIFHSWIKLGLPRSKFLIVAFSSWGAKLRHTAKWSSDKPQNASSVGSS